MDRAHPVRDAANPPSVRARRWALCRAMVDVPRDKCAHVHCRPGRPTRRLVLQSRRDPSGPDHRCPSGVRPPVLLGPYGVGTFRTRRVPIRIVAAMAPPECRRTYGLDGARRRQDRSADTAPVVSVGSLGPWVNLSRSTVVGAGGSSCVAAPSRHRRGRRGVTARGRWTSLSARRSRGALVTRRRGPDRSATARVTPTSDLVVRASPVTGWHR